MLCHFFPFISHSYTLILVPHFFILLFCLMLDNYLLYLCPLLCMLTWRQTLFGKISIELNNDEDDRIFLYMCVKPLLGINLWKVTMEIVDSSTDPMFLRIYRLVKRESKEIILLKCMCMMKNCFIGNMTCTCHFSFT